MNKLLLTAAALLALTSAAVAGPNGPGVPSGNYCQTSESAAETEWLYFKKGAKCTSQGLAYIILQSNGDYEYFDDDGDRYVQCKVDPKTYFKGWANYTCITAFGKVMKRTQKFTTTAGKPGSLSLNVGTGQ
jgi:hypothetical protein